jgi:hypothetical protein
MYKAKFSCPLCQVHWSFSQWLPCIPEEVREMFHDLFSVAQRHDFLLSKTANCDRCNVAMVGEYLALISLLYKLRVKVMHDAQ